MESFDIPINIKVLADNEQHAEAIVSDLMKKQMEAPALLRQVQEWDFIVFVEEENDDGANSD